MSGREVEEHVHECVDYLFVLPHVLLVDDLEGAAVGVDDQGGQGCRVVTGSRQQICSQCLRVALVVKDVPRVCGSVLELLFILLFLLTQNPPLQQPDRVDPGLPQAGAGATLILEFVWGSANDFEEGHQLLGAR